jgi:hypothetical protein
MDTLLLGIGAITGLCLALIIELTYDWLTVEEVGK